MPTHHDPVVVVAGDDWEIPGALFDADGNPLDLTSAEFEWVLVDTGGNPITLVAEVEVTDPADGAISISVPASDPLGWTLAFTRMCFTQLSPPAGAALFGTARLS